MRPRRPACLVCAGRSVACVAPEGIVRSRSQVAGASWEVVRPGEKKSGREAHPVPAYSELGTTEPVAVERRRVQGAAKSISALSN
ncbi:hypothetical protein LZ31DRAFT_559805 [Colletotrichum somersetense]|nr:hypothetical protein LZ31DRAFT_559805 [Colletotrichum somersetense]